MAEIVATISLVANIAQLLDECSKIVHRLHEFQRCGRETPKTYRNFTAELPLLQEALRLIKEAEDAGFIADGQKTGLLSAIDGCQEQIQGLDIIITKTLPSSDDSTRTKVKKTIASLCQDAKVKHLTNILHGYIWTLTFYLAAEKARPRVPPGTSFRTLYGWNPC